MCLKQFVNYLPLPSMEIYNEQQIPHCSKQRSKIQLKNYRNRNKMNTSLHTLYNNYMVAHFPVRVKYI